MYNDVGDFIIMFFNALGIGTISFLGVMPKKIKWIARSLLGNAKIHNWVEKDLHFRSVCGIIEC